MQSQRRRVKCRNSIVRVEGMCSVIRLLATPLLLKTTIFWFHNQGNEPNFQDMLTEVTAFIFLLFQEKLSFFSSAFFFIIKTQWWIHVWEFGRDILIVGYRDVALCLSMPRVNALFFFLQMFPLSFSFVCRWLTVLFMLLLGPMLKIGLKNGLFF